MSKPRIFVAGHKGMVGSALVRFLKKQDFEIITKDRKELDLLKQDSVKSFFKNQKIDQVYLAAAKVGGIIANDSYPAEFIYQNLMIQNNVIHNAFLGGVKKLLFLGSSCIYPLKAHQPIKEEELLTGKLEKTNEPYAIAKIAGIKMCESYNRQYSKSHGIDYRCIMPTNLYGPEDNYHPKNSHVIPGLIYRFHQAKINNLLKVSIWGTGNPKRDFLYVDDMARASIYLMNIDKKIYTDHTSPMCSHINAGSGIDLSIEELAKTIKEVVGFKGEIFFDTTKPDGSPRKLLDIKLMTNLGFKFNTSLKEGLFKTYQHYIKFNGNN
ncbi:GDP-L-fucose synthase [Candidatus Pelagibacter bacterium]|nr:GDP-L-fucose synthase [Candidatus Pelagibacter bacterium]